MAEGRKTQTSPEPLRPLEVRISRISPDNRSIAAAERKERETPSGSCCLLDTVRQRPVPRSTYRGEYKANMLPSAYGSPLMPRQHPRYRRNRAHAEVSAESLYEAIALGLRAIRQCSWVEDIGQNFTIRVLARDTPVEHSVEFRAFHKWLEQHGRSPREVTAHARVREILGQHK
jgi:hypothetical protein